MNFNSLGAEDSSFIAWWIPFVFLCTLLPSAIVQLRIAEQTWNTERILAEDTRRQSLFEETLTRPAFAKDVRLFNLHPLLRSRWQRLVDECYRRVNDVRTRGIRQTLAWSLLSGLGGGIPIVYVIN